MKNEKSIGKTLLKIYDNIEGVLGSILLVAACLVLTWQVFTRYVLGSASTWSEEIGRYMFIWIIFLGCSYAMKTDEHIRVDFAISVWPKKIRKGVEFIGDLAGFFLAGLVLYFSIKYTIRVGETGQFGAATFIPMWIVWLAVPVSYVLMISRMVINFVKKYFLKTEVKKDESEILGL